MLSQHKGMSCLQSGGSRKISAHEAARTHHGPAYNQPLHYVVPTARAAGFQRKEPQDSRKMNTRCSKPERGGAQKWEVGCIHSLPLGLSASGLEKAGPWGFATEQEILQG